MLKENKIFSEKVLKFISEQGFSTNAKVEIAGSAGSLRGYYRIQENGKSLIVQTNESPSEDFKNYILFSSVLRSVDVKVPEVFFKDEKNAQLVMEDFGTHSLRNEVFPIEDSKRALASILYDLVIDELIKMQNASASVFSYHPNLGARKFDYAALKWESDYFIENYLKKHCGIKEIPQEISNAFSALACNVDLQPKVLMHRDFQSENIMILNDSAVGFIDFQGLRRGSAYYDLASLLLDPYVMMPMDLVEKFFKKWQTDFLGIAGYSDEEMWISFLAAAMQRLMQALGAYSYLSKVKGITRFADFINPGKERLYEVAKQYKSFSSAENIVVAAFLKTVLEESPSA